MNDEMWFMGDFQWIYVYDMLLRLEFETILCTYIVHNIICNMNVIMFSFQTLRILQHINLQQTDTWIGDLKQKTVMAVHCKCQVGLKLAINPWGVL